MSAYFVTATGTDVGKTYVTAGIIRAARAQGHAAAAIKPLLSGYDALTAAGSDAGVLLRAMGKPATGANIAAIAPWRFAAPLAPDMAAAREHRRIDPAAVMAFSQAAIAAAPGLLLIEGVGGAMVPLDQSHTVLDWIFGLNIPVILVAGSYLGTISHTLTTALALTARNIAIATIVLSESEVSPAPLEETAREIERFLPATPVCLIPRHHNDFSFRRLAEKLTASISFFEQKETKKLC